MPRRLAPESVRGTLPLSPDPADNLPAAFEPSPTELFRRVLAALAEPAPRPAPPPVRPSRPGRRGGSDLCVGR